ncbi:MAG: carbohydrate kinase family protein [Dermatophilaceae bacterium]
MPPSARVVVVGGAVLDTKVRTTSAPVSRTSNPGTASWSAGGVARNVAENLARLGTPVTLLTAVGEDPAGDLVLARTAKAGVDCRHVIRTPHPTGSYTAVLDDTGDLVLAVADLRATDELRPADLDTLPALLDGAGALVVDANLDVEVVSWALDAAAAAGVPVVLEPVSVSKAARLAPALRPERPVHTVTPNVDELAALVGRRIGEEIADAGAGAARATDEARRAHDADAADDVDALAADAGRAKDVVDDVDALVAAARELHLRGVTHVWVRRGIRGSLLVSAHPAGGVASAHPTGGVRVIRIAAPPTEVADVTGAGDAMTAGYVHGLLAGHDPVEAVRFGQVCAALTCASSDTVRPDLTAALVAAHLGPDRPLTEELSG